MWLVRTIPITNPVRWKCTFRRPINKEFLAASISENSTAKLELNATKVYSVFQVIFSLQLTRFLRQKIHLYPRGSDIKIYT